MIVATDLPTQVPEQSRRAPLSSEFMAALAQIEAQFPVLDWRVGDVPIWPLARIRWMFSEWAAHYANAGTGSSPRLRAVDRLARLVTRPLAALRAANSDASAIDRGPVRRDLLFLSDGVSFAKLGDRWVEKFCDPLISIAARHGLTTALWTPSYALRVPRLTPSRFIQPALDRANVVGALRASAGAESADLPGHAGVASLLRSRGFASGPLEPSKLASDGGRLRALANLYRRRLDRVRPRMAFIVGFYGVEGMAYVLACRESGIPVVDLQHGVEGEMHPAYAAWPQPKGSSHALLPDRFWVWSQWERGVIERWSAGTRHSALVGGNPWMSVWQDGADWPGVTALREQAQALRDRAGERIRVLVTLQYGLDPSEQIEPLARLLRARDSRLAIWVRLHPAMLERREEIRSILGAAGECELDEPTDLALQSILPLAQVHLTHSSSAVIEAAQFGVRSVVTSRYGAELFGPLSQAGWIRVETGAPSTLADVLVSLAGERQDAPPEAASIDSAFQRLVFGAALAAEKELA